MSFSNMNNITKLILGLVIVVAIAGGYFFPKLAVPFGGTSAAGNTYSNAKFYAVVANLANPGTTGTSTQITNTDATDRYITGFRIGCSGVGTSLTAYTGAGLSALKVSIGTSTSAATGYFAPSNGVAIGYTFGTATANMVVASSTTQTATSSLAMLWRTGEILNFYWNATNTAVCTEGVDTIGS